MLFNEIYGSYFQVIAAILKAAVKNPLDDKAIYEIIRDRGFAESVLNIPEKLKSGEWPLITKNGETPVKHEPETPLTTLQRRWLKALLHDPRIRLFEINEAGLADVKPLYEKDTIVYFDQYSDGDPFDDEQYIKNFRTILRAIHSHQNLEILFASAKGRKHRWICRPVKLEYSQKDDKFRLHTEDDRRRNTINVGRIEACRVIDNGSAREEKTTAPEKEYAVMEILDERNALERVMLHFSDLEKETTRIAENRYRMKLHYYREDETEILIRVLSFGPMVKVTEPMRFIKQIKERLNMQRQF